MSVLLPSGYTQIEYIESSGTQYIDTRCSLNNSTDYLEIGASYIGGNTSGCLFGVVYSSASRYWQLNKTTTANQFRLITNNGDVFYTFPDYANKHLYTTEQNKLYIDGNLVATGQGTYNFSDFLYLFARNNSSSLVEQYGNWKLYSCKIYSSSTLIRNFIPCIQDSDDAVGLYDLVNDVFYGNSGSGTFVAGPEVTPKMYFGGTEVNDIYYNGNIVNDVYFNGTLVKEGNYVPV